ncbi:MAG: hypothetical protein ACI8RZ_000589 [Myxococcota bacterium]|jgi:hypothetical protein
MPIPPPTAPPPLRLDMPLPPYRYLPGEGPHPLRHPDGHSRDPVHLDTEAAWLRGLDLYDHRYYWESHEVWEAAWKAVDAGDRRQLLQGLIQLAAATIKHHLEHHRPASLLLGRASGRIEGVIAAQGAVWWGVDLPATLASTRAFVSGEGDWPVIVPG